MIATLASDKDPLLSRVLVAPSCVVEETGDASVEEGDLIVFDSPVLLRKVSLPAVRCHEGEALGEALTTLSPVLAATGPCRTLLDGSLPPRTEPSKSNVAHKSCLSSSRSPSQSSQTSSPSHSRSDKFVKFKDLRDDERNHSESSVLATEINSKTNECPSHIQYETSFLQEGEDSHQRNVDWREESSEASCLEKNSRTAFTDNLGDDTTASLIDTEGEDTSTPIHEADDNCSTHPISKELEEFLDLDSIFLHISSLEENTRETSKNLTDKEGSDICTENNFDQRTKQPLLDMPFKNEIFEDQSHKSNASDKNGKNNDHLTPPILTISDLEDDFSYIDDEEDDDSDERIHCGGEKDSPQMKDGKGEKASGEQGAEKGEGPLQKSRECLGDQQASEDGMSFFSNKERKHESCSQKALNPSNTDGLSSFSFDQVSKEGIGRVFVLDDEADGWIDGPFEEKNESTSDPSSSPSTSDNESEPCQSHNASKPLSEAPCIEDEVKKKENLWLSENLSITEPSDGLALSENDDHQEIYEKINGKDFLSYSFIRESCYNENNSSFLDNSLSFKDYEPISFENSFKGSTFRKENNCTPSVEDSDPHVNPNPRDETTKKKSLLKKGPSSGLRVTFNTNMTVFSEEFPEGECVAVRMPPETATPNFTNDVADPTDTLEDLLSNNLVQYHWLEFMMEDSSFILSKEESQLPKANNEIAFETLQSNEEVDMINDNKIETNKRDEVSDEIQSEDEHTNELIKDQKLDEINVSAEDSGNEDTTITTEAIPVEDIPDKECEEVQVESPSPPPPPSGSEGDYREHIKLSKQCHFSPSEFKETTEQIRSNNEVRQSIEMSALRRSLVRPTDVKRRQKERPKSMNDEQSLIEKLRLLTQDCDSSNDVGDGKITDNEGEIDSVAEEKKDELEVFVQQSVPRLEMIKKRYSLTEDNPYGTFARLPSVRGIRPKYGTTNDILKQLQSQIQPHPLANPCTRNGPLTWPYLPDVSYEEDAQRRLPPNQEQRHKNPAPISPPRTKENSLPTGTFVPSKERTALSSYPECKLRPKRGREGYKAAPLIPQYPSKEERGAPEGASSSPKIITDGWNSYPTHPSGIIQNGHEMYSAMMKRNSFSSFPSSAPISRQPASINYYPPPCGGGGSLHPLYEVPPSGRHPLILNGGSYYPHPPANKVPSQCTFANSANNHHQGTNWVSLPPSAPARGTTPPGGSQTKDPRVVYYTMSV